MNTRSVVLYIAMSADGYIAKTDGDLAFLSVVEQPGEDYGYAAFTDTVDTVIMGRKTYEKVLSFGIEFPHKGRACYIMTRTLKGHNDDVTFCDKDIATLITELKAQPGKNIFIDGGAKLVHEMMQKKLIDKYIISVIPYFTGGGIRLFKEGFDEMKLTLSRCQSFASGLVQLEYVPA
jgi:dihydrofolate reductase